MRNVRVYTGTASSGDSGVSGWAAVLLQPDGVFEISGCESESTNSCMQISAAINGLNAVTQPSEIALCTDSKYIVNAAAGWIEKWSLNKWHKADGAKVQNADLWQKLVRSVGRHEKVVFKWLRGHSRDQYGEWADSLARSAMTGRTTPLRACTMGQSRGRSRDSHFSAVRF